MSSRAENISACRSAGILPVDGPFGDFSDDEGFLAQARRAATMGMVGKWAIHPSQIALANEVFSPSEAAVTEAREILAAMERARAEGAGATVYKGRLVDIAVQSKDRLGAKNNLPGHHYKRAANPHAAGPVGTVDRRDDTLLVQG